MKKTKRCFVTIFILQFAIFNFLLPPFGRTVGRLFAQNCALVLNGGYVKLNGGTSGTPVYLVVNQSNTAGIARLAGGGHIISENEYNYVKWNVAGTIGGFTVPFGYSSTDYLPLTVNKTTAGSPVTGYLLTSTYATGSANTPWTSGVLNLNRNGVPNELYVLDRWWIIVASSYTTTKPDVDLTFTYRDAEWAGPNAITEANLQAQRWNSSSSQWGDWGPSGTVNTISNTVTVNTPSPAITAANFFKAWVLVDNSSPLPIRLLYFNAFPDDNAVRTEWTTATEINNDYFAVLRSKDGGIFEQIGTVQGAGNSNTILKYVFYDDHPYSGISYYRLKQVDYDGKYEYSEIKTVYIGAPEIISIYPNPAGYYIYYLIGSENGGIVTVKVIDAIGKQLVCGEETINEGVTTKKLSVLGFSSGIYLLQITTQKQEKFQKQFMVK